MIGVCARCSVYPQMLDFDSRFEFEISESKPYNESYSHVTAGEIM